LVRRFQSHHDALRYLRGYSSDVQNRFELRHRANKLSMLQRSDRRTLERLAWCLFNDNDWLHDGRRLFEEHSGDKDKPNAGGDDDNDKPDRPDRPKPAPKPKTKLRVFVLNKADDKPIEGVKVTVKGQGEKTTNAKGVAEWDPIDAGTYEVSTRKDMHGPDPAKQDKVVVPEGQTKEATLKLEKFELHLHLDADRDGTVDADWKNNTPWEAGAGKFGAVVIFNNDNDDQDAAKQMDFENGKVDTAADLNDVLPLEVRRHPAGATLPPNVTAEITISDTQKLRILKPRAAAGTEFVGPGQAKGELDNAALVAQDKIELGMEGLQYPDASFDGKVQIKLDVLQAGSIVHSETAEVRIAPWLLFNHRNETEKVFMLGTPDNAHIRTAINTTLSGAGIGALQAISRTTYGHDRWVQDGLEPGFASIPSSGGSGVLATPATLRTALNRSASRRQIDAFPKRELLDRDYGFVQATAPTTDSALVSSLDSFGNLECSPPFTHKGKGREFAFGRAIFGGDTAVSGGAGNSMHPEIKEFLHAQKVQDPVEIHTDWLNVGHVDEFVSFLPNVAGSSHGWKVMIASPKLALDIVLAESDATPLFHGADLTLPHLFDGSAANIGDDFPLRTVGDIRADTGFRDIQDITQGIIDDVRTTELMPELDLKESDFIHIPILFTILDPRLLAVKTTFIAYTAGSVNMLVVTETPSSAHLCIPKPYGPFDGKDCLFEKDITAKLSPHVSSIKYIDDLQSYHTGQGEIHCGSNSQRTPPSDKWWDLPWV